MHPQLTDKKLVCKDFIIALEACHQSWVKRITGGCNDVKHELGLCLRKERMQRASSNREEAKIRRARASQAIRDLHVDD
ncbi:UPF0287-domain-containing protein [Sistotremastrum niveocremeum HHB9708]|uniref:COX assembly mitochondrial protein n=2 Tax=Sistotremastraceae TaxID=3402574 RepID=A0A164QWF4_9AGAM|nr:UPF0287-domain-containing protein [Sistotremastrum niveocremeum HHB9708]KZT39261.1 UPF0287-domain-containing protein [Sistotremastrum suecicum HHB10207 ss-3]